jgi:hypothetical protein
VKKNRSTLLLVVLLVVVAIGGPYYFSSQKAAALDLKTKSAQDEVKSFREKSVLGERIRKQSDEWKKSLETLQAAMPANPDIQGAIRTLQGLTDGDAAPDRVKWISGTITGISTKARAAAPVTTTVAKKDGTSTTVAIATAPVAATTESTGFDLSISVEGSRAKVLAFVTKIQQKPEVLARLFAVKSVTLTPGPTSALASAGTSPATTAPTNDSSVIVKAEIKLKVTGFGTPTVAESSSAATAPIAAGPATSVASSPATSAPNP